MTSEPKYDYEKIRKALVAREFTSGLFTGAPARVMDCTHAYEADETQLLNIARRHGLKLENFILKE